MANELERSFLTVSLETRSTGVSDAVMRYARESSTDYLNSGGTSIADRQLLLKNYSLTTSSGNLDIDLYDLGTLDVGSGPGRDNLGNLCANARVLSVFIENLSSSNTGVLRIDQNGLGSTAWSGLFGATAITNLESGAFVAANLGDTGATVTDVTDHMLRLSAQTADCTINVHLTFNQT